MERRTTLSLQTHYLEKLEGPAIHPLLPFMGGTKRRPAISRSGSNLIAAVPHQNFPCGQSQKLRQPHKRASIQCPDAKENPGNGGDAGAQEQATADGRSVSGRPRAGERQPSSVNHWSGVGRPSRSHDLRREINQFTIASH